jgi:hypothetical protein
VLFLQGHRGTLGDRYSESDIKWDELVKRNELTCLRDKGVIQDFDVWRTGGIAFIFGTWYTSAYSYTHVNDSPACGEGYRRSVVLVPGRQEEYYENEAYQEDYERVAATTTLVTQARAPAGHYEVVTHPENVTVSLLQLNQSLTDLRAIAEQYAAI